MKNLVLMPRQSGRSRCSWQGLRIPNLKHTNQTYSQYMHRSCYRVSSFIVFCFFFLMESEANWAFWPVIPNSAVLSSPGLGNIHPYLPVAIKVGRLFFRKKYYNPKSYSPQGPFLLTLYFSVYSYICLVIHLLKSWMPARVPGTILASR